MDNCQTPDYALDPLLPYLPDNNIYWESASGEGYLAAALNATGRTVIATDILTGGDFFTMQPRVWDVQVTNPPFGLKFKWLARSYELGKPFALLLPVEVLGSKTAQQWFEKHGMQVLLLDKRVNFKMPVKGWGGQAQFPVCWITSRLNLPDAIVYGHIDAQAAKDWDSQRTLGPVVQV